jgi:hypothetical protein
MSVISLARSLVSICIPRLATTRPSKHFIEELINFPRSFPHIEAPLRLPNESSRARAARIRHLGTYGFREVRCIPGLEDSRRSIGHYVSKSNAVTGNQRYADTESLSG